MSTYFFQLGNTPQLSILEIEALLEVKLEVINDQLAALTTDQSLDLAQLQLQAGGLVKTYQHLSYLQTNTIKEIENRVVDYLSQYKDKVVFGVTALPDVKLPKINLSPIKQQLKTKRIKSRYLDAGRQGLTAAVLTHHQVHELVIIRYQRQLCLAKTVTIQDIDDWSKRDRSKPYANRKKGMLPPKVARIMINLTKKFLSNQTDLKIYDPFCGSGTILMEALLRDCQIVGSDLDINAVKGTKENLAWLTREYQLNSTASLISQQDVVKPWPELAKKKVDAIVTEPFLGKPKPKEEDLKNIFIGLYRTYLGAFKNWTQVLKPGGVVAIIFPLVETKNKTYDLNKLIDKLSHLGYTTLSQPVIYSRPQAIVKRQLNFLRYKG